ncbi:MAG: hypothetical protein RLZZ540_738 [Bacteroidota bacterium]|jgi:hypothetical protein
MKIVASRLSEGNKIFPAEIHIEENGIKVKIPGFLSGDTRFINYENISSVNIDTPMIGFSSLTFYCQGNRASAHGFKKDEAKQIKEAIDRGKAKAKIKVINHNHNYENQPQQYVQKPIADRIIEQPVIIQQPINVAQPVTPENTEMYSIQLEKLIAFAMADGELSEKEKQILFKKAEAEGIDLDEFEMVLEAKIHQRQPLKNEKQIIEAAPKSDKLGDIRKCSACGAITETFATKCSDCGTEFRNIEASQNIIKFFEKLDEIESNRKNSIYDERNTNNIGIGTIIKWFFFWIILLPLKITSFFINKSKPPKWSTTDSRKEELILNFPIPISREEILEFLTLASSKINTNTYFNAFSEETKYKNSWNKIWLKKIEQIQSKASLAMKNDGKTLEDVNRVTENARVVVQTNDKKVLHIALGFVALIITLVVWVVVSGNIKDRKLNEEKELKAKAETFIKSSEYNKAEEIILTLNNQTFIVELRSEIQLEQLVKKLDNLEVLLSKKNYSKLKLELEKLIWTKQSKDYDTESTERESYKVFLKKKEALNNQLPEKFRIEIESEYSL